MRYLTNKENSVIQNVYIEKGGKCLAVANIKSQVRTILSKLENRLGCAYGPEQLLEDEEIKPALMILVFTSHPC